MQLIFSALLIILCICFIVSKALVRKAFYPSTIFIFNAILLQIYSSWLLLPFSYSAIEGFVSYRSVQNHIDNTLMICNTGTFFLLIGYLFNALILKKFSKKIANQKNIEFTEVSERETWINNLTKGLVIASVITLICFAFLGSIPLLNVSDEISSRVFYGSIDKFEKIRPIYNMSNTYIGIANGLLIFNFLMTKKIKKNTLIFVILSSFITILTGTRGYAFTSLFTAFTGFYTWRSEKANILKILILFFVIIISLGLVDNIRAGRVISIETLIQDSITNIFVGNTFTDFRDFTWFLSARSNENYTFGITQICSSLSFLPSALFRYRRECTYGAFTAKAVGLDPDQHFGIRISAFGEQYISFGIIGVILLSLLLGYFLSVSDNTIDKIKKKIHIEVLTCSTILLLSISFWLYLLVYLTIVQKCRF